MNTDSTAQVISEQNAEEFFREQIQAALMGQSYTPSAETTLYLGNLLTLFVQADRLFQQTHDGIVIQPLAGMYADAAEASSVIERDAALKRLGDVALFIAGLFPGSLQRSLVDVDYYINMGGSAYAFLAESSRVSRRTRTFKQVFQELSSYFQFFVDVLARAVQDTSLAANQDILRLYEMWLCSGSSYAQSRLQSLGVQAIPVSRKHH